MNRRTAEGVHSPGQVGVITVLLFVTGIKSVSVCRGRVQGVHSPTDGA